MNDSALFDIGKLMYDVLFGQNETLIPFYLVDDISGLIPF